MERQDRGSRPSCAGGHVRKRLENLRSSPRGCTAVRYVLSCAVLLGTAGTSGGQPSDGKDRKKGLGERLVRKAVADGDEDVMAVIVRLMTRAVRELEIEFNPGNETQALQEQIVDGLDRAIEAAAARRRPRSAGRSAWQADKRKRAGEGASQQKEPAGDQGDPGSADSTGAHPAAGPPDDRNPAKGGFRETRRTWGVLPEREREEVIQGATEAFLERYRFWIERYYEALQEADK